MATEFALKLKIPTVDKFCCCIALQTGGVVLGVVEIVARFHYICKKFVKGIGVTLDFDSYESDELITEHHLWDEEVLDILSIALNCISMFVAGAFIAGIFKERPNLMLPLVVTTLVTFIVFIFSTLYSMFSSPNHFKNDGIAFSLGFSGHWIDVLWPVLLFYFWIVEYSLYKAIKFAVEERNQQGRYEIENEAGIRY